MVKAVERLSEKTLKRPLKESYGNFHGPKRSRKLHLEKDIWKFLDRIAEKKDISRSELFRRIISHYREKEVENNGC
ncbi:MAG: ribbon-helix-helix domain-containing protein [Candidatus Nanohaloarchaea archaeon]